MTTASTSTNDHAATAPQLPPMQLSGALDTTACTTYDGALFGISAEMIKWAKDRKDRPMSCLCRHQQVKMNVPIDDQTIRLWTLNKIRLLLAASDRTLAFFDLPELTADEVRLFDRLEERLSRFDRQQCAQDAEAARARLNHDQRIAFDGFLRTVELDVVDQMRDDNLGPQHVFVLFGRTLRCYARAHLAAGVPFSRSTATATRS
ncbi:BZ3500_MvSof-1268-A1-R1_Chr3-3g06519 [Microbotryum saponariae]|uniref:BZ3500_MvSof-1268-A1-R1_Chr3-3g06519 protein n=1 Tax=Microbotryum saponariae TaxID=289078 RepID=A0A2X0MYS4_9BASI|nr:BZ3500_MvSof-1268-A1-R1_Chr3-3g06519 [Microbotryum saponariae]SDA04486.1 BZ3501_MvSof-1269-A2-R1_Chr3-2g06206 [Microbotryum saponariae]